MMYPTPTPCDQLILPVYFTTATAEDGVRVAKEMFADKNMIVVRWNNGYGNLQRIITKPGKWENGVNWYDPMKHRWKYF